MSVPLLAARRTRPRSCSRSSPAAVLNQAHRRPSTDELFAAILTLIVLGFALARHHEGRDRWVPLGRARRRARRRRGASSAAATSASSSFVLAGGAIGGAARARAARR